VSDTGVGMTPEVLQRIFDPFFTTKRQQGTGLGLSISQTLVTRQGGKIFAESTPGQGTTFSVWLPEAA
jgi:signal transduction histidine kinase